MRMRAKRCAALSAWLQMIGAQAVQVYSWQHATGQVTSQHILSILERRLQKQGSKRGACMRNMLALGSGAALTQQ